MTHGSSATSRRPRPYVDDRVAVLLCVFGRPRSFTTVLRRDDHRRNVEVFADRLQRATSDLEGGLKAITVALQAEPGGKAVRHAHQPAANRPPSPHPSMKEGVRAQMTNAAEAGQLVRGGRQQWMVPGLWDSNPPTDRSRRAELGHPQRPHLRS